MIKRVVLYLSVTVLVLIVADHIVGRIQVRRFLSMQRIGNGLVFEILSKRISAGMTEREVQGVLRGFREMEKTSVDGSYVVSYGYWFGFLPPMSKSGLKYWGEVEVEYTLAGYVIESSYWYN